MKKTIPGLNAVKDKKFLVTGGAGFIGSHLVAYLVENGAAEVRVLDNLSTGFMENVREFESNPAFTFILGDISHYQTCLNACEGVDGIFHNAALGSVSRSMQDPMATNQANVSGFVNVLFAAKNCGVKRVIYASSSSVYGDDSSTEKREDVTGNLLSPYAVSKKTNELYADVFSKSYGMEIIGLRYFNVYGPKQNPNGAYAAVIPIFISNLLKNSVPTIFGDGTTSRDFTYIDNVVYANVLAFSTKNEAAVNQVYNVAYGASTSLNQLFALIKSKLNSSLSPQFKPERKGDIKNSLADINKAKRLLDYSPLVNLDQGLSITIDWYQDSLSSCV
ncbi:MAG: UDP-glucose 4-epimerase [Bacteroidota bacterium]|jgi:UDP-N-acetylglucosamine 4-epimerase|nr:UDP-glucose 4-epimerase [Bacteroidota bacterium]